MEGIGGGVGASAVRCQGTLQGVEKCAWARTVLTVDGVFGPVGGEANQQQKTCASQTAIKRISPTFQGLKQLNAPGPRASQTQLHS